MKEEIIKYTIVGIMALRLLFTIQDVGKERKPISGEIAASSSILNGLIMVAIILFWH